MVRATTLRNTRRPTNNNFRRRRTIQRQRPLYKHRQTLRRRRNETSSRSKPFAVKLAGRKLGMETMITGVELRDQSLVDVAVNADPVWWQHAVNIVRDIAATSFDFTTDDIWHELERRNIATPHEPRAIGAVVVVVKRSGLIAPTNRYRPSIRPECHARPIRVWQAV
jgi:hypothetical protein